MPSQRKSWQQRWTVRTAVSQTRLRRSSDERNAPTRGIGRMRETARTNSSVAFPCDSRSMRTKRKPVLPISSMPRCGSW